MENKKEIKCCLCGEKLTEFDIPDIHHKDGNHKNNKKENKVLVHHVCHMKYHKIYPENYNNLRQYVEAMEDYQKTRMALKNQMTALNRLGFEHKESQDDVFKSMKKEEGRIKREYAKIVRELPIWKEWLCNIHGIGEDATGQIIGRLGDISRFERISKLWSYCGYGLYDGKVQGLKKGQKHNYNTKMRSLMYKIVTNGFIMHKKDSYYGQLYDKFKKELREQYPEPIDNPKYNGKGYKKLYTDMHIHLMAIRKVAKVFLKDLWIVWRSLENLPISQPYEVEHLNHQPHEIPHFKLP